MLDFLKLKTTVGELGGELRKLRSGIERRKREYEDLSTAPLSREELTGALHEMIENQGNRYPEILGRALAFAKSKPFHDFSPGHLDILGTLGGGSRADSIPRENLAWFLRDLIKTRLTDAVAAMPDWPDSHVGPPLAERKTRLARLDKEIAGLETKELELRQQAEQAGISLNSIPG